MKKNFFIWAIAAILVIFAIATTNSFETKDSKKNSTATPTAGVTETGSESDGIPAPDFSLMDLSGNKVQLSSLVGKKVYLNFWATWCGYCVKEMPDLEKIHNEYKDQNLVVLAINVAESESLAAKFMKENNYSFTALLDSDGKVAGEQYGVKGYPTSIFINSDGTVNNGVEGMMTYEAMKAEVEKLK